MVITFDLGLTTKTIAKKGIVSIPVFKCYLRYITSEEKQTAC